jgi:hypothetical protein
MCRQPRNVRQTSRQISTTTTATYTSLTHVTRLAAHPTMAPTPAAMGKSFIMTLYNDICILGRCVLYKNNIIILILKSKLQVIIPAHPPLKVLKALLLFLPWQ